MSKPQTNWKQKVLDIKKLNEHGTPLKEAVKLYDWTIHMYRNYHRRLDLPRSIGRKFKTNLDYFENIDTEYKAYFLGFIYADGCIHTPKSNRSSKVLSIKIQEQDGYILDKLAKEISPNRNPIKIKEHNSFTNEICTRISYSVNSDKIYNDLYKLGVREKKSYRNMIFPKLPEEMYRHFIRGFLDGDGYICKSKNKITIGFVSTDNNFLLNISNLFSFKFTNNIKNKRDRPVYCLTYQSKKSVNFLKNYLYKDSEIYLTRKFEKLIW